ncbi:MAG: hypothetical protein HON53_08185 [Planctomycetaceae bacterium]|nr:hypothetical protein [Planctomycetaceae bacterium]MBT6154774.1 hypothetical protein [Planctomycetaceae bacterium]MBT6485346.1 hypothetical protein [Planctomycetaceae bacterium]MBT6493940.1 hypothetical protein [Planctomycetaceae bacterium]
MQLSCKQISTRINTEIATTPHGTAAAIAITTAAPHRPPSVGRPPPDTAKYTSDANING